MLCRYSFGIKIEWRQRECLFYYYEYPTLRSIEIANKFIISLCKTPIFALHLHGRKNLIACKISASNGYGVVMKQMGSNFCALVSLLMHDGSVKDFIRVANIYISVS